MDADGDFVVAWESHDQDGSSYGIYAQRYNAAGVAQGGEFRVNTFTTGNQGRPSVAMDADGDFVVAWDGQRRSATTHGIFAQRFDAAGVAQGNEFRVNTTTTHSQTAASVAMDSDGDFVITWNTYSGSYPFIVLEGVLPALQRRRSPAGSGNSASTRSDPSPGVFPSVAMDADGDFVIAWNSYTGPGDSQTASLPASTTPPARRAGREFRVNTFTIPRPGVAASVAMDADGDFVVVWSSDLQDGSDSGVFGQRFNAAGVPQGSSFASTRSPPATRSKRRWPSPTNGACRRVDQLRRTRQL